LPHVDQGDGHSLSRSPFIFGPPCFGIGGGIMRLALLAVLVWGVHTTDQDPPVISLALSGVSHGAEGVVSIVEAPHPIQSSAQFADECCGGNSCDGGEGCVLPVASAFDHHDGDVTDSISTTYELFIESLPGTRPNQVQDDTE
jgi:hypothetical protein